MSADLSLHELALLACIASALLVAVGTVCLLFTLRVLVGRLGSVEHRLGDIAYHVRSISSITGEVNGVSVALCLAFTPEEIAEVRRGEGTLTDFD
ncbi:MAG TPA: hypothetical protein VNS12_02410 [Pelagibacterium sp.]|uniref:hypothetical protein n=1 Tax=Pelagibacterium sp. TaxID=1967288 RepID=UPI002D1A3CAE|nr:hypothetical protein [Pelagibacterium sp.]HWJ86905.1 hypothetical protein [Pelagibacterium sp.]